MRIRCHVPVTVRVTGELSAERRDLLRRAVARAVAARLAAAERTLARRGYGTRDVWLPPSSAEAFPSFAQFSPGPGPDTDH